ncbi:MAG: hypothetical protein ACUZ8I_03685 [Candidatus Scalindua sp.]
MRIKSFIASTVQEALADVKREMGDSSIILETRNIEEGDIKSKAGQKLVEVVAAENIFGEDGNRNSDHNMDKSHDQDAQSDDDGINPESSDRHQPDIQQPGRHSPALFQARNGQKSLSGNRNGNGNGNGSGTLADRLRPEDMVEMADLSTTVSKPDWQIHPNGNGRSDQDSLKPYPAGNGSKDRPGHQMDSDIPADLVYQLLSDDLIKAADYSTDEGSVQDYKQKEAADEYQNSLSLKDETIHQLTAQIDKQKKAAAEYQNGLSLQDKNIRQLTAQIDKQKEAAAEYQNGLSVKDETIRQLTARIDKQNVAVVEYQNGLSEQDETIRQFTARIDKQNVVVVEYQNGLSVKDETIRQLTARIDKQNAVVVEYQNGLSEQDETIRQLTARIDKQNVAAAEYQNGISRKDETIHWLTAQIDKQNAAVDECQQNCDLNVDWSEKSKELYKQLCVQQVEKEHSKILINEVLSRQNGDDSREMDVQRLMIRESIMNKIESSAPDSNSQEQCKTMAFIGAAGTGKTTTILKLASDIKERSGKDILLISIRGDFAGKLNKMSGSIEATVLTASTPQELREIIDEYGSNSHILIDTPGVNHFDKDALSSLKEYLDEIPDLETHLVVSAATRYIDIINTVKKLNIFPVHRLLFTKVDETDLHGTLFSVVEETQIPLSYVTDGQEIPDGIRPATAEMVAEMVVRI